MTKIRIFSDKISNFFFIEGVESGPVSDFVVTVNGNLVSIFRPSLGQYQLKNVPFEMIVRTDDTEFDSAQDVADYVNSQLVPTVITVAYPLYFDETDNGKLKVDKLDISDGGQF